MPVLAFRLATPNLLVDLRRLPRLSNIAVGDDASACKSSEGSTSSASVAAACRIRPSSMAWPFSSVSTLVSRCRRGQAPITPI